MWTCPVCAAHNAQMWMLHAFRGCDELQNAGYNVDFVTLTARGGLGRTRERTFQAFKDAWPKLSRRAKYHNPYHAYIAIPEQHKDGTLHLHMLITNEQKQKWWKDNAYKSGLGWRSWVDPVEHGAHASFYVSKYLGKDFISLKWPPKFRRARASQNWPKLPAIERPPDWLYEVFRDWGAVNWEAAYLRDAGYDVDWKDSATKH